VEGADFDEERFFDCISRSGARALLIGRRALVALGIPVLTADYHFWIHIDDAAAFSGALAPLGLFPSHTPDEARARGRYVLENDEHVDVLVARSVPTTHGQRVVFDGLWERRRLLVFSAQVSVAVPSLDDLIATKHFAARPKDLEDIRLLEALRDRESGA
jgi:hypothetical protein